MFSKNTSVFLYVCFFQFIFMAVIYYKARGERDYHGSANFHDSRGYKESLFFSR